MDKKKSAKFSLYDGGCDLTKHWYVWYWDATGKKIKVADGINRLKTVKERNAKAKLIISVLEKNTDIKVKSNNLLLTSALADAVERRWIDLRSKTRQTYQSKLTIFLAYCKSKKLIYTHQIDVDAVDAFFLYLRTVRKNGNTTLNHYREVFFTLFAVFTPKDENPFERLKLKKSTPTPALYFQNHQRKQLKAYISKNDAQLWRFIEFVFYCFIRPGELRQLKVGDVFLESAQILVRKEISKNKKDQYVTIPDAFLETLEGMDFENQPPGFFIFSGNGFFGEKMIAINKMSLHHQNHLKALRYDTTRHKLYSWKHTGAVAVVKAGIHIKQLQMQLRHHSLDQVNEYLRDLGVAEMDEIREKYPTI